MNVQPKPSPAHIPDRMTGARESAERPSRSRVPVAGPRLLFTWPVEFEVEPWRP